LKKIQGKKLQTVQNYIDPNNDNKIDEEPIYDTCTSTQLFNDKKQIKNLSPQHKTHSQQLQTNSLKNSIIS
jgi:hypothetical protein